MYVRDLAESMLRRWYFVVVALAITAGACFLASTSIPPTYQTEASVVLIPPKSVEEPTANPFLALSSLAQAVDVLSRALNADETHAVVHKVAPAGTFEVAEDGATSAPVLIITAQAASSAEADALVNAVLKQVPATLSGLQSALSIAEGAEITSIPLDRDENPVLSQKARLRAIAALTILCMGGSALLIGALDGILLARSARKERTNGRDDGPSGADSDVDAGELDGVWLESELASISGRVAPTRPATSPVKAQTRRGAASRDRV